MIQTWLPLPNFEGSAASLSDEHLDMQLIHILELLEYFHTPEDSALPLTYEGHNLDKSHPLVKMWVGYELQLIEYGYTIADEWEERTGRNSKIAKIFNLHAEWAATEDADMNKPNWFGDVEFHLGHQAELLRENSRHYAQYFLRDGDREMIWPKSNYAS